MSLFYSDWFYEKQPLGYDPEKEPESPAEQQAMDAIRLVLRGTCRIDWAAQMEKLLAAAKGGYTLAWSMLGWCYHYKPATYLCSSDFGHRGSSLRTYRAAEAYYEKGIAAGDLNALYGFGMLSLLGSWGQDSFPGLHPVEGLASLLSAARQGMPKAMLVLGRMFRNDVFREERDIACQLNAIARNRMRDKRVLRYNEAGETVFDPDAFHMMHFACMLDEVLADYWLEQAQLSASGCRRLAEPEEITRRMQLALEKCKAFEVGYLAHWQHDIDLEQQALE